MPEPDYRAPCLVLEGGEEICILLGGDGVLWQIWALVEYGSLTLWIRRTSSMPSRMIAAEAADLKPSMDRIRSLMQRWSCSTRLFM
jgi:hypothetical protein